jgi:hypothetical protein
MKKNEYRNEFEVAFCRSKFLMRILGLTFKTQNFKNMAVEIITREDLMKFKRELLIELRDLIKEKSPDQPQWIKAPQVRKMLHISPGTLQNLRINGTLPYTKIGGVTYYAMADIEKVMSSRRIHNV